MPHYFDVEKTIDIRSGYSIKTGLTKKNGEVPVTITAPTLTFETQQAKQEYCCMRDGSGVFLELNKTNIPFSFDWKNAIADLVFPKLNAVPYGNNAYVKKVNDINVKGSLLEIKCAIAPIPSADVTENFNYRTAGNVGRF